MSGENYIGADGELLTEIDAENPALAARALAGSALAAIRRFCLQCMAKSTSAIKHCPSKETCPLYAFRFGRSPRAKRELTEEQRKAISERFALARAARGQVVCEDAEGGDE